MDKYDAANDHYCYANSATLKNKLNITSLDELESAEREITAHTVQSITFSPPPYDLSYMSKLHCGLFSELYDWAGDVRTVDISKGGTRFCTCGRIEAESAKLFTQLEKDNWLKGLGKDKFCEKLAEYYIEFNMIHPFREGNGRVQRLLFEHLALSAGYDLDWNDVEKSEWVQANIDGVDVNYGPMEQIFKRIVTQPQ
ncbi:putative adenosine monophosphate-protein transferase Fic [Vibrio parahaemolyticus]|uniref:putative adenosine monophosphate-protein transferase Fic n=1 Tax=Vibrio harveyi group TaxID=717610 RepID=UPI000A3BA2FA|nr:putative adenosine monophosphate-protein transferase Fic [Vibrio parahaemolyticus]ELA9373377.1 putative adenosine monophosphate-protein transferase Fic [Vibrio parahaemolyticus]MBE3954446.1 putative adenosine monophosphate-protein transferase Fic [Vibrio parahaemolyticus]MBE4427046.1 putative adenosine monophosphate-protein transferase Fic [Vibrio parahaemolyticus]OUJ45724.1 cell filamentation protein Fic [Vibrio parahaemolyticus]TOE56060.1 cell filamentation protein Fic [Vibrio parahaemoly